VFIAASITTMMSTRLDISSSQGVRVTLAGLYTFVGAVCFGVGSYLLIPELFDGERRGPATAPEAFSA